MIDFFITDTEPKHLGPPLAPPKQARRKPELLLLPEEGRNIEILAVNNRRVGLGKTAF